MPISILGQVAEHQNVVFLDTTLCFWAQHLTRLSVQSGGLQAQYSDIEALVEKVKEARLKDLLKQGIGYLHEGMHPADQDILHTLFQSGATQVCWPCYPPLPCPLLHTCHLQCQLAFLCVECILPDDNPCIKSSD